MEKQITFTDIEYTARRKPTKREIFLEQMNALIPWEDCVSMIEPYYPSGSRGRPPRAIEQMLRMLLLQSWFNLSDEGIEAAIYDSYAMKDFMGIDFGNGEQVPDATTLCKFRKLLTQHGLQKKFFDLVQKILKDSGKEVTGGTIVDATIIEASSSRKNKEKKPDPEMHSTRKGTKWYYGMRLHTKVDPVHGFVQGVAVTPANEAEVKVAASMLHSDDSVVYGDAGYCKLERYTKDGISRSYRINRQRGTFIRHYGDSLSWQEEKKLEQRKSSVRCKVEYAFHIVKDIFHWRKVRYRGIAKNTAVAYLLCASANIYMLATMG